MKETFFLLFFFFFFFSFVENACRYSSDILQVAGRFDNPQYAIAIWVSNAS